MTQHTPTKKHINYPLLGVIALGLMQNSFTANADTDSGVISISGTIVANTCILKNKAPSVNMGAIKTSDFQGDFSAEKSLTIELENCGQDVTTVDVNFTGTSASGDQSLLSVGDGEDAPKNVGIQLVSAKGTPIDIGSGGSDTVDISSGSGAPINLEYKLKYKKIGIPPITAGPVSTTLNFELSYQ
ncbi:fimbrial protein [Pseudomonas chlororaphis]|uniref:fimbrial protein n=1 Tax=Pseudomonas chlororaphis TaxID=587753 RepID=UPI0039DF6914